MSNAVLKAVRTASKLNNFEAVNFSQIWLEMDEKIDSTGLSEALRELSEEGKIDSLNEDSYLQPEDKLWFYVEGL